MLHLPMAWQLQDQRREAGRRYREALADRTLERPNAAALTEAAKAEHDRLRAAEIETWRKVEAEGRDLGDEEFVAMAQDGIQQAIEDEPGRVNREGINS